MSHLIELGGYDEVVLVQAFDLLGLQRHGRVAPAEADIRMMALRLGQIGNTLKANASAKFLNRKVRSIR